MNLYLVEQINSANEFNDFRRGSKDFCKRFSSEQLLTQLKVFLTAAKKVAYCQVLLACGTLWSVCAVQAVRVG